MKILITGGAGYIGTTLTQHLLGQGYTVRCYDRLLFGIDPLLPFFRSHRYELIHGDIRDEVKLAEAVKGVDAIVHLAAVVGYPACDREKDVARSVNVGGTETLNNLRGSIPVIYASTGSVYGKLEVPCSEDTQPNPLTVYGQTKLAGEQVLLNTGEAVVYRFATAFGLSPRLRLDLLVNDFTYQAIRQKYLIVYEGHFRRTFIHVHDIARALAHAVDKFAQMKGNVYNCGSNGMNATKRQIAEMVGKYAEFGLHFTNNGHDLDERDYEVDYSRLHATGFNTTVSLDAGIYEMVKAFRHLNISNPYSNVG